jgi:hypothetical protein
LSTKVSSLQPYEGPRLARPDRIIVHNFAATPADIPAGSAAAGRLASYNTPQTPQEIELGRQLGAQVAKELVNEIRGWGLPAVHADGQPEPRVNDIVLMGYFESVDSGSGGQRIALGFGAGAAKVLTALEAYQMTDKGLRRLGGGTVQSEGGKTPGVVLPVATVIATANPIGLIVSGAVHAQGEVSGRTTVEGAAKRTAKEIGKQLKVAAQREGWI